MAERPIWLGAYHRILVDEDANTWKLQFYDSDAAAWKDIMSYSTAEQAVNMNPLILKSTPAIRLKGAETDGIETQLKEDTGSVAIHDVTNAVDLMKLLANKPFDFDTPIFLIFERPRRDLAADSTGRRFTSSTFIPGKLGYIDHVFLEATWTATHSDSVTKLFIYDDTDSTDVCSVSGNEGYHEKSDSGVIIPGHVYYFAVDVTTASATTGATTDAELAVLHVIVKPS